MQLVNKRKRKFGVAPAIIHNLISRQAGSLGKAVLEAVMNSIDAGATAIDITIDPQTLTIMDNGCGIQNFEQIEQ